VKIHLSKIEYNTHNNNNILHIRLNVVSFIALINYKSFFVQEMSITSLNYYDFKLKQRFKVICNYKNPWNVFILFI